MTPERWQQIEPLCHAVLERDPDEREAYLRQACGDDAEMRREVDELIGYQARAGGFMERPAIDLVARQEAIAGTPFRLREGTCLGPYQVLKPLGAGGMGEVYRARDTRLGRVVALKILPAELANDPWRRHRFEVEARAVAALNHPNIVALYDVGDGYLVSELVHGKPLSSARLGLRKVIEVAVQIATGLAAAHGAGITHRDLKPANILLTRDGRAKILDFGLAKMGTRRATAASTETAAPFGEAGMVVGTVGYMSPEQVRGESVDGRSDIFSLGVILHELLSGARPFRGDTNVDTMRAILREDPPELPECVPAPIKRIVAHCLEKEPDHRFQSASDLAFALGQAGTQALAAADDRPVHWRRWATLAVMSAVLAGLAGAFLKRAPKPVVWSGTMLGGPDIAMGPRISPDGDLLAFMVMDQGLTQVAVMKPESGNWSMLTHRRDLGTVSDFSWSPDGTMIYYDRDAGGSTGIYRVPVLGGDEHLVLAYAKSPVALRDGSLLVYRRNAGGLRQLHRFWPETGRVDELPFLESNTGALLRGTPWAGADAVLFGRPTGDGTPGLFALNLASNTLRRVTSTPPGNGPIRAFAPTRDGKSVLAAIAADTVRVSSFPLRGQSPEQMLFTTTSDVWSLDSSPDGSVYATVGGYAADVVRLPAGGGESERIGGFPRIPDSDSIMVLPDGRAVVPARFAGRVRLMVMERGKEPVPLANTPEEIDAPMTIAGPRRAAFAIGDSPRQVIAVADIESGRIIRRIAPRKGALESLTASRDGQTLYFAAGGSIWAVSSFGGEPRRITGGNSAVMEPSGNGLIVERRERFSVRLFIVPVDGGAEREIPLDPDYRLLDWPLSPSGIDARGRLLVPLFLRDSWFSALGLLDTKTGRIRRLPGEELADYHSAGWMPDGHIVAIQRPLHATLWKFTASRR